MIFCLDIYNIDTIVITKAQKQLPNSEFITLRKQHRLQHQNQNNITLNMQNSKKVSGLRVLWSFVTEGGVNQDQIY